MFCVIYRFLLQPHQENDYKKCWDIITDYFIQHKGSLGSCLHKSNDNLWIAYSRWPNKETRDNSWSSDIKIHKNIPDHVYNAMKKIKSIIDENAHLPQFEEITMQLELNKL